MLRYIKSFFGNLKVVRLSIRLWEVLTPANRNTMSSGESKIHAAVPYDVAVGWPIANGASPDAAKEKSHWMWNGSDREKIKGFVNPWPSAHDFSFPELFKVMFQ